MTYHVSSQAVDDQTALVTASGELDLYSAPELKERVTRWIDLGRTRIVIDMSEATFIDSTAIGVLVGGLRRVQELGGSLELVCVHKDILRVLDIVGLDQVFAIHESREDALASQPAVV
jgi:anti-sigma B factor antagonist